MLLAIDAGNTRTKWAVFNEAGTIDYVGSCLNDELVNIDISPATLGYQHTAVSNVAGEAHETLLTKKLASYKMPVSWIKSVSQACNVINNYETPAKLGSDRWAGLVAAWHFNLKPCIVVNAGTAVTIDALNTHQNTPLNLPQAEFLGGMILPGLHLMQQSLGLAAAQLPSPALNFYARSDIESDVFARNTADAIYAGALHAIVGAIGLVTRELNAKSNQTPCIIISGGDANSIYNKLSASVTNPVIVIDNLVLQGLFLLAHFIQKE